MFAALAIFATASVLLVAAGLYGVISQGVKERAREIGLRMALGAERRAVLNQVLGAGLKLTAPRSAWRSASPGRSRCHVCSRARSIGRRPSTRCRTSRRRSCSASSRRWLAISRRGGPRAWIRRGC